MNLKSKSAHSFVLYNDVWLPFAFTAHGLGYKREVHHSTAA